MQTAFTDMGVREILFFTMCSMAEGQAITFPLYAVCKIFMVI